MYFIYECILTDQLILKHDSIRLECESSEDQTRSPISLSMSAAAVDSCDNMEYEDSPSASLLEHHTSEDLDLERFEEDGHDLDSQGTGDSNDSFSPQLLNESTTEQINEVIDSELLTEPLENEDTELNDEHDMISDDAENETLADDVDLNLIEHENKSSSEFISETIDCEEPADELAVECISVNAEHDKAIDTDHDAAAEPDIANQILDEVIMKKHDF